MRAPRGLATALATGLAAGLLAAPTPDQSPRRNDPALLFLRGRVLRPTPHFPREERLATFVRYDLIDTAGRRVGFLLPMEHSDLPAFRVATPDLSSQASFILDRRTKALWFVRNKDMASIGRLRRTKVVGGEYDWTDAEGNSIAAFVPVTATNFYQLRGGDELRAFLVDRCKLALPEPAALRVRRAFEALYRE